MAEKSPDNTPQWAARLDALEQIPGDSAFDRQAAWSRLQAQLNPVPAGAFRFRYWYSTAALLLLMLGFYWWAGDKSAPQTIVKAQAITIPTAAGMPDKTTVKNPLTTAPRSSKKTMHLPTHRALQSLKPAPLPEAAELSADPAVVSAPDQAAARPLAALPIPKKLEQVHLNDLPGEQENLVNEGRKPYPRKFIRRLNNIKEESLVNTGPAALRININTSN